MGTVAVVFNIGLCILTVCTSVTFRTSCTVFNDGSSGVTVTVGDGYSVGAVAVVFNIGLCILTVCTSCTGVTFFTGCTSSTVFTIFTVFTVFNDGSSDWAIT